MTKEREGWRAVTTYVLEGTYLECVPEHGSGLFFVVDSRRRGRALTSALPLQTAQMSAERKAWGLKGKPKKKARA